MSGTYYFMDSQVNRVLEYYQSIAIAMAIDIDNDIAIFIETAARPSYWTLAISWNKRTLHA